MTIARAALTFIGFRMLDLEGRAFPGRPLTPPIRGLPGVILLGAKCIVSRSLDRHFAMGVAVAISLGAETQAWDQFASFLLK